MCGSHSEREQASQAKGWNSKNLLVPFRFARRDLCVDTGNGCCDSIFRKVHRTHALFRADQRPVCKIYKFFHYVQANNQRSHTHTHCSIYFLVAELNDLNFDVSLIGGTRAVNTTFSHSPFCFHFSGGRAWAQVGQIMLNYRVENPAAFSK